MNHHSHTAHDGGKATAASEAPVGRAVASAALLFAMYAALVALTLAWNWTLGSFGG